MKVPRDRFVLALRPFCNMPTAHLGHGSIKSFAPRKRSGRLERSSSKGSGTRYLQAGPQKASDGPAVFLECATCKHTIVWTQERPAAHSGQSPLPPGSCNLYTYPSFLPLEEEGGDGGDGGGGDDGDGGRWYRMADEEPALVLPTASQIELLDGVLLELQRNTPDSMRQRDESGAQPAHALCVANTEASLSLAMRLYTIDPELIAEGHVDMPGSPGAIFRGENCLHCLAVNSQHEALVHVLRLAARALPAERLAHVLNSHAEGK